MHALCLGKRVWTTTDVVVLWMATMRPDFASRPRSLCPKKYSRKLLFQNKQVTKTWNTLQCCEFLAMHSESSGKRRRMDKTRQTCCMYGTNRSKGTAMSLSRSVDASPGHVNISRTPSMWSRRCLSSSVLGTSTSKKWGDFETATQEPCFRIARSSLQGLETSLIDKLKFSSWSWSRNSKSSGLSVQAIKNRTHTHSNYCVYHITYCVQHTINLAHSSHHVTFIVRTT